MGLRGFFGAKSAIPIAPSATNSRRPIASIAGGKRSRDRPAASLNSSMKTEYAKSRRNLHEPSASELPQVDGTAASPGRRLFAPCGPLFLCQVILHHPDPPRLCTDSPRRPATSTIRNHMHISICLCHDGPSHSCYTHSRKALANGGINRAWGWQLLRGFAIRGPVRT